MLPPVWCASHVVGEKPSQAAWDRPWVPGGRLPSSPCVSCDVADAQPTGGTAAGCQPPCHRLGISHVAGHTLPRHPINPLLWGVIGYQRQIDQTRRLLRSYSPILATT